MTSKFKLNKGDSIGIFSPSTPITAFVLSDLKEQLTIFKVKGSIL